eukprot:SAG11_NODE_12824_length_683_cov_1.147260_1_plen_58_part_00
MNKLYENSTHRPRHRKNQTIMLIITSYGGVKTALAAVNFHYLVEIMVAHTDFNRKYT